jgi:nucleotide-binding universal stress UspA family protein
VRKETVMAPIRKLLCPVDFSPPSEEALAAASELAAHFAAELMVLHAVIPSPVPIGGFGAKTADVERIEADREEVARRSLQALVERIVDDGVVVHPMVVVGEAADTILEVARSEGVDLIVLATHGATGWRRWFLGSIADRVLREARCRVLTIHPSGDRSAGLD